MTRLKFIALHDCNSITNNGITALSSLTRLDRLSLRGCRKLTNNGMEVVKVRLGWDSSGTDSVSQQGMCKPTGSISSCHFMVQNGSNPSYVADNATVLLSRLSRGPDSRPGQRVGTSKTRYVILFVTV